ncbi:MAG: hemerythrin domain-containing protein [Bacteroidales bacterium]|nr:hemerythrin domain-containing protein [Bacteroidales bacterium]MDE7072206.1 hemerythrin domain-containing protein [Bacteroidales bacterium]
MNTKMKYAENDKMSALVCQNYYMLFVLSRFGIPMGFGESSIGEVCRRNGIDTRTFLAVVNMNLNGETGSKEIEKVLIPEEIVRYLHNSHEYFLDYRLPSIRTRLLDAISDKDQHDVAVAVMRFYDDYVAEVKKHMQYEEQTVFPYIRALVQGKAGKDYHISIFRKQHNQIESQLTELRDILLKYYTGKTGHDFNAVLFDIFTCAEDLRQHNALEDVLLVPLIERLEK